MLFETYNDYDADNLKEDTSDHTSTNFVSNFLKEIGLQDYASTFEEIGISGDVLLKVTKNDLDELGVSSALDKIKIMVKFPRYVQKEEIRYPLSAVIDFLNKHNMSKYSKCFQQHQIDGEMLMMKDTDLVKSMLEEIGIKGIAGTIIIAKFETFVTK